MERSRKHSISRMEAYHTSNRRTYLEVRRSKVKVTRPANAVTESVQDGKAYELQTWGKDWARATVSPASAMTAKVKVARWRGGRFANETWLMWNRSTSTDMVPRSGEYRVRDTTCCRLLDIICVWLCAIEAIDWSASKLFWSSVKRTQSRRRLHDIYGHFKHQGGHRLLYVSRSVDGIIPLSISCVSVIAIFSGYHSSSSS